MNMKKKLTFIAECVGSVVLLDDVVNVADSGRDEEGQNEGDNIMSMGPDTDVECVENCEEWETPSYAIDNDNLSGIGELEDDVSEQQEVNKGPDEERPPSWGDVSLLGVVIDVAGAGNGVDV